MERMSTPTNTRLSCFKRGKVVNTSIVKKYDKQLLSDVPLEYVNKNVVFLLLIIGLSLAKQLSNFMRSFTTSSEAVKKNFETYCCSSQIQYFLWQFASCNSANLRCPLCGQSETRTAAAFACC